MARTERTLYSERVTLRVILVAALSALLGVLILLIAAQEEWWTNRPVWQTVLRDVGALFVVSFTVLIVWELVGKRAFLDEVLTKANLSRDIKFAGITQVTDSFHADVAWKNYISASDRIDIFFAYGRTWRAAHNQELQAAAQRKDCRIRVVLPDPNDELTVAELARRFKYDTSYLIQCVREAEQFFQSLRVDGGAQVSIWHLPACPVFSFYRFDHVAVIALYSQRKERVGVPTFVCEKGGTLYEYVKAEFAAMVDGQHPLAKHAN